jgi:hypothetical protein
MNKVVFGFNLIKNDNPFKALIKTINPMKKTSTHKKNV